MLLSCASAVSALHWWAFPVLRKPCSEIEFGGRGRRRNTRSAWNAWPPLRAPCTHGCFLQTLQGCGPFSACSLVDFTSPTHAENWSSCVSRRCVGRSSRLASAGRSRRLRRCLVIQRAFPASLRTLCGYLPQSDRDSTFRGSRRLLARGSWDAWPEDRTRVVSMCAGRPHRVHARVWSMVVGCVL